jgi:hypothetical protein
MDADRNVVIDEISRGQILARAKSFLQTGERAMTKFADDAAAEHAKKQLAEDRKIVERSRAEYAEHSKGKPTPTQEENDLAALGAHIIEHDDDGSGPDPYVVRNMEAASKGRPATYQTKAAKTE